MPDDLVRRRLKITAAGGVTRRWPRGSGIEARTGGIGAAFMATTLKSAVESYLRAKTVVRGTRNEYFSTLRKWEQWGGCSSIEELQHKQIREFLDWVHERALAQDGTNPGRTANKARDHL